VDDVEALQREDEGVADGDDPLQGLELLAGAGGVVVGGFQVAVDELDRLEQAAGGFGLPDLPEAAPAQALDQPVAGERLGHAFDAYRHGPWVLPGCEGNGVGAAGRGPYPGTGGGGPRLRHPNLSSRRPGPQIAAGRARGPPCCRSPPER